MTRERSNDTGSATQTTTAGSHTSLAHAPARGCFQALPGAFSAPYAHFGSITYSLCWIPCFGCIEWRAAGFACDSIGWVRSRKQEGCRNRCTWQRWNVMSFYEELQELVRRTRSNPELFHRLVYEPETVLGEIGFLSEGAKRQIMGLSPAELTARLLGCEHGTPGAQQQGCAAGTVCDCTVSGCVGCTDGTCGDCTAVTCNQCATACVRMSGGCSDCTIASQCAQCTEESCQAAACTDATCHVSCGNPSGCGGGGTCGNTNENIVEGYSTGQSAQSPSGNFREFRL